MMKEKGGRNSAIELLRIIAMIGVVILHYNSVTIGGAFKFVESGTIQEKYLFFSQSLFICVVNLFMIISAYFLATTEKRRFIKVIELMGHLIIFKLGFYLASVFLGNSPFSFSEFVRSILPNNYFIIFYCIVYTVSPYINVMVKNISRKDFTKLVIILFSWFSIWPAVVSILQNIFGTIDGLNTVGRWGDQQGFTIVNFFLMYFIGAYIRLNNISMAKTKAVVGIFVCIALIFLERIVDIYNPFAAWDYNNPVVVLLPVFLILLFTQLEIHSKVINELARAAFTCYVFHEYLMPKLGIEKIVNGSVSTLVLHQFGSAMAIYLISYVVYKIYHIVTKPVIKWLSPKCEKVDISL